MERQKISGCVYILFGLLLVIVLGLAPFSAAAADRGEPLRVIYGFDREFPPFSYEEAGGNPTGFEVEVIRAVFQGTNVNLSTRPLKWETVPIELSAGTVTLTTGMVQTEQRSQLYLFSRRATFPLQIRLFTKIYNRKPGTAMLRGLPVSVEQGSLAHRLLEAYGGMNIKTYKSAVDALRALYNDEVAAYCGPVQNTYYYIGKLQYGAITTVGTPLGITEMRVAVNRDRGDILKLVDEGLERVVTSGEYDRLYRKWFVRELSDRERKVLRDAAVGAAVPSYVPYGQNGMGAAVLTASGKVYGGTQMENADPALTLSAMRSAVAAAIGAGDFELRAAVLVAPDGSLIMPGPEDLQVLSEFGRGILVPVEEEKGKVVDHMVAELLPNPTVREIRPLLPE